MKPYTIFIVDDEKSIRQGITFGLKNDYHIESFATAGRALSALEIMPADLILMDIGLPGMDGIEALKEIKSRYPEIMVIMITAYDDLQTVVRAMKKGAHDYLVKPIQMDTLRLSITNALRTISMKKEIELLQEKYLKEDFPGFIGESDAIQDVMEVVNKIARSADTPVLIVGESGSGKQLIASAIHYKSPNFKGPFVALNCAAIPKDLVESELFGYEKGAFSGAASSGKKGLVEEAAEGTLFLDEVGDLSLEAQAKLLRFVEEGEYFRVGGTQKHYVTTRIVSATNKNLTRLIEEDFFREDLYYRLAVIKLEVPGLNERPNDIIPFAKYFVSKLSQKFDKHFSGISPEVETFLINHNWKGNIRELRNLIERGILIGSGPVLALADILTPTEYKSAQQPGSNLQFSPLSDEGIDLGAMEAFYIGEAMNKSGGNEAQAAKLLNMSYYAFRYRRKKIKEQTG